MAQSLKMAAPPESAQSLISLAQDIIVRAQRLGADVAEAVVREGTELSARVREGELDNLTQASHRGAGLRVIRDQCVAYTTTSDLTEAGVERFVRDAIELVELSQADPFAGPVEPELLAQETSDDLDLYDPSVEAINASTAIALAMRGEVAARRFDARITNLQSASFASSWGASAIALSNGFHSARRSSGVSVSVVPVADDQDGKKRRGSWGELRRHWADLPDVEWVGRRAAERTVAMLGARKVRSCEAPVIFPQEVARSVLGMFGGCALGSSIWRGASYLIDREGSAVAAQGVTLVDEPRIRRGLGSRIHDGEGLASRTNVLVEKGILRTYLCDAYAGRKLGRASTASAARGASAAVGPSASNLVLEPGEWSEEDIIASTKRGLLVRSMMGFGFNAVTGDLSRGAAGLWIEDGKIAFPVSEVTISLNLDTLLKTIDAIGNKADMRGSILSPMFRVSAMAISGSS